MRTHRLALAVVTLFFGAEVAVGCMCDERPAIAQAVAESELVVTGTVVSTAPVVFNHPSGKRSRTMYNFAIVPDQVFKGVRADTLYVLSEDDAGGCGFMFTLGETYVIYADVVDVMKGWDDNAVLSTWVTSRCTRTRAFDESEVKELEALK